MKSGQVHIDKKSSTRKPEKPEKKKPILIEPSVELKKPLPEKPESEKLKRGVGRPKKLDYPAEWLELKIPIGLLAITITEIIAEWKKDKRYNATDREVKAFEDGFNKWVELRSELLKKLLPEFQVAIPVLSYLGRIMSLSREKKTTEK